MIKNERNTVQLTSIRTKGEKRDGHNNQKATHRLQKTPNFERSSSIVFLSPICLQPHLQFSVRQ